MKVKPTQLPTYKYIKDKHYWEYRCEVDVHPGYGNLGYDYGVIVTVGVCWELIQALIGAYHTQHYIRTEKFSSFNFSVLPTNSTDSSKEVNTVVILQCTCGADSVNGKHSSYCDKFS